MKTIIKIARAVCSVLVAGSTCLVSTSAFGNPRPLPFTYPYETLAQGETEVELYGDMTPLRVNADAGDPSKGRLTEPRYVLQTEIEYGITPTWELGFYQVFEANPQDGGSNAMTFDGFKWRVRHRFAEAGELPVDVAVYFELETLHDEVSLEEKLILAKRFGRLRWMANAWVEEEMNRAYDRSARSYDFVVNPTTGLTYELSPVVHVGVEYWGRGVFFGDAPALVDTINHRFHSFVGPTFHANFGTLWWTFGVYANLNNVDTPQIGETYGPLWARSVLGLNL